VYCREETGEVVVGGRVVIRLRGHAGGWSPAERCLIVAWRLQAGLREVRADRVYPMVRQGQPVVGLGGRPIVAATAAVARANRTSPAVLAWVWSNQLREALGERPLPPEAIPYRGVERIQPVVASWYGFEFAGRPTASGEPFDPRRLTAAHRSLPFGTVIRVIHPGTGRQAFLVVNDRGPFVHGRDLDLSLGAAEVIGLVSAGVGRVLMEVVALPQG
jgi:hypothetical protein